MSHEDDVHREARRTSVPVEEWMNKDHHVMEPCCEFYRVHLFLILLEPSNKIIHLAGHIDGVGWRMISSSDDNGPIPVFPRPLLLGLPDNKLVQLPDEALGDGVLILRDKIIEKIESLLMILCFQVIPEWLSFNRHALLKHEVRLAQREAVAFDCVGIVGHFDFQLFA